MTRRVRKDRPLTLEGPFDQGQVKALMLAVAILDDGLFEAALADPVEVTTTTFGDAEWDEWEINVMIDRTDAELGEDAERMLRAIAVAARPTGWEYDSPEADEEQSPYSIPFVTPIGLAGSATLAAAARASRESDIARSADLLRAFCATHAPKAAASADALAARHGL